MSGAQIRLTRTELYQKVWSAPRATVAKEFGLSAWALSNACRRHNIPVPPVGHWTKVEMGRKITPPPLIPDSDGRETVEIYIRERLSSEPAPLAAETPREIEIPKVLSHPLALKMEEWLASAKENDKKLIVPNPGNPSYLLVSREQLPRALRILNALFQALEDDGHTVSWPQDERSPLTVSVEGEAVAFSLRELIDRTPHVLTPSEQKHPYSAPKWDYKLTGRLRLSIDNLPYASASTRASWADGKTQILENCLGHFLPRVRVASAAIKKSRLEQEEWHRHYEEVCKRREEWRRLARERERKAEVVGELIEKWEKAQRIRKFVKAVMECIEQFELSDEKRHDIQQLLDWSNEHAASLDPLSDLPNSIDEFVRPKGC